MTILVGPVSVLRQCNIPTLNPYIYKTYPHIFPILVLSNYNVILLVVYQQNFIYCILYAILFRSMPYSVHGVTLTEMIYNKIIRYHSFRLVCVIRL